MKVKTITHVVLVSVVCCFGGVSLSPLSTRIVGGSDANIDDFRYQALFFLNDAPLCGACIISDQFALTAAHCILPFGPSMYFLRAGSADRHNMYEWRVAETHRYRYPNGHDNDVGLIKVVGRFDDYGVGIVKVVKMLAPGMVIPSGADLVVSGWGYRDIGDPDLPVYLQYAEEKYVDWEECRRKFPNFVTENMICTIGNGTSGACRGDNGGPLVYYPDKANEPILVGFVLSTNHQECGRMETIYGNIISTTIRGFIHDITGL